jgi:myosin heavy subunit
VEVAETIPVEELQPKNETEINIDARAGSLSDLSSGTILLELDDEVEPVAGVSPDKIEETEISEPQALKIENAAQELSAAIEEQKAALTKARALKKQKEAQAKAQALKKQKEALAKAQALKKQKEARAKVQASKMQKLVLANAEALKRKKAVQAKAQALIKQKAAQATIEAAKKGDSAAVRTATAADRPKIDRSLQAGTRMQTLLEKFKGRVIGINYDNSAEFKEAQLVEANAEYFCVFVKDKGLHYSYPLKTILTVIEGKNGVDVGDKKQPQKFNAVIKVYPLLLF